jgi:aquaporin Z
LAFIFYVLYFNLTQEIFMTTSFDMRRGVAEALGTAGLVFFGGAAAMVALPGPLVAVGFGLALALMIFAFGGISGGHFNPAVSFAFFLSRKLTTKEMGCYWVCQLIGATIAVFALTKLLPSGDLALLVTKPIATISTQTAFAWEAVMTFVFVSVILSVVLDKRANTAVAPLVIGLTLFINALIGGGITGASLNPARSIIPAYFNKTLDTQWIIYVAAPLVGAFVAAYLASYLRGETAAVKKPATKPLAVKAAPAAKAKPAAKKKKKAVAKKPIAVA